MHQWTWWVSVDPRTVYISWLTGLFLTEEVEWERVSNLTRVKLIRIWYVAQHRCVTAYCLESWSGKLRVD